MVNREYTNERALPWWHLAARQQFATYQPARETMDKPIVLTSEDACPECKGFNLSMQTNPVHDPVHHYECHDCWHSWDVQPSKGIVLTAKEREALKYAADVLHMQGQLLERVPDIYERVAGKRGVIENLLARAGATENTDGSALRNK